MVSRSHSLRQTTMSLLFIFLPLLLYYLFKLLHSSFYLPRKIRLHFLRQGISGPKPRLFVGNTIEIRQLISEAQSQNMPLDDQAIAKRVMPYHHRWSQLYGKTFLFWFGSSPRLVIGDPAIVREVIFDNTRSIERQDFDNPLAVQLIGEGLLCLKGKKWARHRRIVSPAFGMERVKGWGPEIAAAAEVLLNKWESQVGDRSEFEVDVHKDLYELSSDVISRVAFGSSYEEGKRIFELQEEQMHLVSLALRSIYIPGFRFIPTKRNRRRRKVDTEIRESLWQIIKTKSEPSERDRKTILDLMLLSNRKEREEDQIGMDEIIDECKTFYFAGKETTASTLTWAMLLLAINQEWQDKAREEATSMSNVVEDIGDLKIITMVLYETLRLYPPAVDINRMTSKNVKLGNLDVPAKTHLCISSVIVNRDTELWGTDADKFNPERFANGKRKSLGEFFPFGFGPMICVGQNLAMVEAKVAVAMILRRFKFNISPTYVHAPVLLMTSQPQYGMQMILQKV